MREIRKSQKGFPLIEEFLQHPGTFTCWIPYKLVVQVKRLSKNSNNDNLFNHSVHTLDTTWMEYDTHKAGPSTEQTHGSDLTDKRKVW